MVPIFKSDYSIGKSILTLKPPSDTESLKIKSESIFDLAQGAGLSSVVLVEDNLTGFLEAQTNAEQADIQLIFGLRLSCCEDSSVPRPKGGDASCHKIIIFPSNAAGCGLLNKIYSHAFTTGDGRIDAKYLKTIWDSTKLKLGIPFYDSFIFNNLMSFNTCVMDLNFCDPTFFLEDNSLPFDSLVRQKVQSYCSTHQHPTEEVKSIFYNTRADFAAFQTYKCICSRGSYGRSLSLSKPNLDHCSSPEFCLESWQEKQKALGV